jgi:hypothetical protein
MTYAPSYENYEKEQVPYRSIRYRMGVPQRSPSGPREAKPGTSKATQPAPDPRRGVLCAQERLPLATFARRLPTLEDGLPLVQEMAHRVHLRAAQRCVARELAGSLG